MGLISHLFLKAVPGETLKAWLPLNPLPLNNDPERNVTATWRYYISNHHHLNKKLPGYIRNHWGIENKLHWVLDVQMKEDDDQKMEKKSARSFALLRRIAMNVVNTKKIALQQSATIKKKPSLRSMMKRAGWNNDWLLSLLQHI